MKHLATSAFHEALALVRNKDEGVTLAMDIVGYLGLRAEKAVQSAKSLKTWQQAQGRGDDNCVKCSTLGRQTKGYSGRQARRIGAQLKCSSGVFGRT